MWMCSSLTKCVYKRCIHQTNRIKYPTDRYMICDDEYRESLVTNWRSKSTIAALEYITIKLNLSPAASSR